MAFNSLTLKDVQDMSLQLINQYSIAGSSIASSYNNQQDYLLRIPLLVNAAQNYVATTAKKIFAEYVFVQNPAQNVLTGDTYMIVRHKEQDITFSAPKAKAYYFDVDGDAEVRIVSGGAVIKTINVNHNTSGFQSVRGFTSATGDVTLVFAGAYPYNIRNVALYDENFAQEYNIPSYAQYNEYEMPDDFFQLCGRGIPQNTDTGFKLSREYKWRGQKTLIVDADMVGEWKVDYYRYPAQVTMDTPLESELDNVPEAQHCIPFYIASHLVYQDDPERARQLNNEFEVRLSRLQDEIQTEVNSIEDVYGIGGGCY